MHLRRGTRVHVRGLAAGYLVRATSGHVRMLSLLPSDDRPGIRIRSTRHCIPRARAKPRSSRFGAIALLRRLCWPLWHGTQPGYHTGRVMAGSHDPARPGQNAGLPPRPLHHPRPRSPSRGARQRRGRLRALGCGCDAEGDPLSFFPLRPSSCLLLGPARSLRQPWPAGVEPGPVARANSRQVDGPID